MSRQYELNIVETAAGETLFSKGHHDAAEFIAAARTLIESEYGEDLQENESDVMYERWRTIPVGKNESEPFGFWYVPGEGRGSFPVTRCRG